MNFDNMIKSNAKKAETKKAKKSSKEIIPVSPELQGNIDNLLAAKKAKKVAESDIKKNESPVIEFGTEFQESRFFDKGDFEKSYKFGNDDNNVTFVTANKWSFDQADVGIIKEIIEDADGEVDDLLEQDEPVVKFKSEVFSDPELQKELVKMVGKKFDRYFETIEGQWKVKEDFDKNVLKLGKNAVEDVKVYMKKSKPSLR